MPGWRFDALLKAWKPLMRATAQIYETEDAIGSNAGHSIGRHGPQLTDEELLYRLTTGIAADNHTSTTIASSKFETIGAWLEAREQGAAAVEATPLPSGDTIAVTDTSIPADAGAFFELDVVIDHHGPIDKAFVGVKPNRDVNASSGKVGKGSTYETYEELSGITKSKMLWLFDIDIAAIATEIKPPRGTGPGTANWNGSPAEYMVHFEAIHGPGAKPTNIPGKWVMMQLFPLVKGWDQEKQDYA